MISEGSLEGKAVVVTGAGRGIGRSAALEVALHGAAVVVNDIDREQADEVVEAISASGGTGIASYDTVSSWSGSKSIIDACVDSFGTIDGLVNNAAIHSEEAPWQITEESIRPVVEVNLLGSLFCGVHAITHMKNRNSGSIVNVSSSGAAGTPHVSIYGATKGGMTTATYSWALDLLPFNVRVNAIYPWAATRMTIHMETSDYQPPSPETNVPLICYLLSDKSTRITGQVFSMRGTKLSAFVRPGSFYPPLEADHWTMDSIAEAFKVTLDKQLLAIDAYPNDAYIGEAFGNTATSGS